MSSGDPQISVVLRTYQRRELVLAAVRALVGQTDAPSFEVVVVVDGSTDGSADALRAMEVPFALTVVEQPNSGGAAASNRGVREARGELVLLLDDDMEADPRLLAEHWRSYRDGADVVFGHIPLHPDSPDTFLAAGVGEWAEERKRDLIARGGRLELTDFLNGQMSLPREIYTRLGGFDAELQRGGKFGGADFDFGRRLAQAGYAMVFNPDAISWQRYEVSPRRYLKQWRDNGRARAMLARRYPDLASTLLNRRERTSDRLLWRWLRAPLRRLVLAAVDRGSGRPIVIRWFYRVQDLEYFAGVRAAGGVPGRNPVYVFCYHSIHDLKRTELAPWGMPTARFRRQLRLLSRFFNVIDADDFVRWVDGGIVPRRAALITFDDGLVDLRDIGLPLLREAGAPAVSFAVTQRIGQSNVWSRHHDETTLPLLDADGLRTLAAGGIEIGAHTRTHRMVEELDFDEAVSEIAGSVDDLEELGFPRPRLLAYPYGFNDEKAKQIAARAGLVAAFTTKLGVARPGVDPYEIPRIEILRRDWGPRFVKKVLVAGRR